MEGHVWGVDVAVDHLEFAFADLSSDRVHVETLKTKTSLRDGQRLEHIRRRVIDFASEADVDYPAYTAWVEQPSGRFPQPQLAYCAGVVQAGLAKVLATPVWTIPSSAWKKRTVGPGNASKAQVAAWVEGRGYTFDGQDQADAIAIACAGRAMVLSGQWEAKV